MKTTKVVTKSTAGSATAAPKKLVEKAVKRTVKPTVKSPVKPGTDHPHLETARLMEGRSTQLLQDMHQVLQKHGFENLSIHSIAFSSSPSDPPSGLCPQWRCHTDANGNNVCGWVLEPC